MTAAAVLEILVGEKRFDGGKWVSYDAGGTPLVDTGGVLWRGLHGALLWPRRTTDFIIFARRICRR